MLCTQLCGNLRWGRPVNDFCESVLEPGSSCSTCRSALPFGYLGVQGRFLRLESPPGGAALRPSAPSASGSVFTAGVLTITLRSWPRVERTVAGTISTDWSSHSPAVDLHETALKSNGGTFSGWTGVSFALGFLVLTSVKPGPGVLSDGSTGDCVQVKLLSFVSSSGLAGDDMSEIDWHETFDTISTKSAMREFFLFQEDISRNCFSGENAGLCRNRQSAALRSP